MKGIILAGGTGSRLFPCTAVTNKHLLAVFNQPMIYYPLQTMVAAGVKEILLVSTKEHIDEFKKLLSKNNEFGDINFSFAIQKGAGGIAQGLSLGQKFVGKDKVFLILGDNLIGDNLQKAVLDFDQQGTGACMFLKKVSEPSKFEVAVISGNKVTSTQEKPMAPKSDLVVAGVYMFDNQVWQIISGIQPSIRGELEITDVNNY